MSLSNEERIKGIMFAIKNMVEVKRSFIENGGQQRNPYGIERLFALVDRLWSSFLGRESNGQHWLLGSSAGNTVYPQTCTPWGMAIKSHCERLLQKKNDFIDKKIEETFDAFDGFLDIKGLLSHTGNGDYLYYEIYAWAEQVIYYLRRYEDEFLKSQKALSDLICDIQGECFSVFSRNDVYARAYLVHQILKEHVYGRKYPYDLDKDPVAFWFQKDAVHHGIAGVMDEGPGLTLEDIAKIHIHVCKKGEKLSAFDRIEIALKFSGRHYHYDHEFKELLRMIAEHKLCTKAEVKKLTELFEKCKKDHDDNEKKGYESYKYRYNPTDIYLYGVD